MLTILIAMQKEADILLKGSEIIKSYFLYGKSVTEATYQGKPYRLIITGVGKTNAAAAAMLAIATGADILLNIGVAGGLTPKAKIGALLQIQQAVQFDFDLSPVNHTPVGTLDEYLSPYFPLAVIGNSFPYATLATADHFGCGGDGEILQDLCADVRDMEGAAIAHVAFAAEIPCFMFKAISDSAGEESVLEYSENLAIALNSLKTALPQIFSEVFYE